MTENTNNTDNKTTEETAAADKKGFNYVKVGLWTAGIVAVGVAGFFFFKSGNTASVAATVAETAAA